MVQLIHWDIIVLNKCLIRLEMKVHTFCSNFDNNHVYSKDVGL